MTFTAEPHPIKGIYWVREDDRSRLATINYTPGKQVYGERLIKIENKEYRIWDPHRSKFAAGIMSGMKSEFQFENQQILYLGAASGTTSSHFSDATGKGMIFCVEFSRRAVRDLVEVCNLRQNMTPILADARQPADLAAFVSAVDIIYQDVAQPDQTNILIRNIQAFLKEKGKFFLAIKARSIDVTEAPEKIFQDQIDLIEKENLKIREVVDITRFEKDHCLVIGEKL